MDTKSAEPGRAAVCAMNDMIASNSKPWQEFNF